MEQTFLSDLSFQLSEIYQRPESCIVVALGSPQAMLFGGSSEPAYYMTISALASEFAPTKNKRSTGLIQGFMHEFLGIAPSRGIIRFEPVSEENLATNGITTLQEIEDMERSSSEDSKGLRTLSRNRSRMSKRAHVPGFMERGKTPTPHTTIREKLRCGGHDSANSTDANGCEKKQLKARKSFMALFGR